MLLTFDRKIHFCGYPADDGCTIIATPLLLFWLDFSGSDPVSTFELRFDRFNFPLGSQKLKVFGLNNPYRESAVAFYVFASANRDIWLRGQELDFEVNHSMIARAG